MWSSFNQIKYPQKSALDNQHVPGLLLRMGGIPVIGCFSHILTSDWSDCYLVETNFWREARQDWTEDEVEAGVAQSDLATSLRTPVTR